jgi:hypothetical protein
MNNFFGNRIKSAGRLYCCAATVVLTVLLSPGRAAAGGEASAAFLKLGVGARPVAMGSAFSGLADDINSLSWNPAGLSNTARKEFSFMHLEHFQDIKYNSVSYSRNWGKTAAGFGFGYLSSEGIARTFIDDDAYYGWRGGGNYGFSDMTLFAAISRSFAAGESAGVLVRWLSETIEDHSASAAAMDFGYLRKMGKDFSMGLAAQNIGGTMRFISAQERLPSVLRVGAGWAPPAGRFRAALDFVFPSDYQMSVNIGGEYIAGDFLRLRAGWRFKDMFSDDGLDDITGLSAGAGFAFFGYNLDYAFVPYGDLGYSHRISLGGRF